MDIIYSLDLEGERLLMTGNEVELINIVREHSDPESALIEALEIIILYLKRLESFGEPSVAYLPEPT